MTVRPTRAALLLLASLALLPAAPAAAQAPDPTPSARELHGEYPLRSGVQTPVSQVVEPTPTSDRRAVRQRGRRAVVAWGSPARHGGGAGDPRVRRRIRPGAPIAPLAAEGRDVADRRARPRHPAAARVERGDRMACDRRGSVLPRHRPARRRGRDAGRRRVGAAGVAAHECGGRVGDDRGGGGSRDPPRRRGLDAARAGRCLVRPALRLGGRRPGADAPRPLRAACRRVRAQRRAVARTRHESSPWRAGARRRTHGRTSRHDRANRLDPGRADPRRDRRRSGGRRRLRHRHLARRAAEARGRRGPELLPAARVRPGGASTARRSSAAGCAASS